MGSVDSAKKGGVSTLSHEGIKVLEVWGGTSFLATLNTLHVLHFLKELTLEYVSTDGNSPVEKK